MKLFLKQETLFCLRLIFLQRLTSQKNQTTSSKDIIIVVVSWSRFCHCAQCHLLLHGCSSGC